MTNNKKYDLFISHASEDKEVIVRPLVYILEKLSLRVWYDEFALKLGDSLSASIDKGLKESCYGLIILSKNFLVKNWTDYEYRSLLSRQNDGERVILPLWYNVNKDDIKKYSLYLADIKGFNLSKDNLNEAIQNIVKVVRPDIWREMTMRSVLRKLVDEGERKTVNLKDIHKNTERLSRLTSQQLIRSKAVYYGIGSHLDQTFKDYVFEYELDAVPERELQAWEIMNACYLEMLDRHPQSTEREKNDYYKILIALSIGAPDVKTGLSDCTFEEVVKLWEENYYEF